MKKYKGWEIAKLISEGKLEGKKIELLNGDVDRNLPYMVSRAAMWDIECEREIGNSLLTDVKNEYIIPQEPVSFMDCVNSDKLVRVEHELISNIVKNEKGICYIPLKDEGFAEFYYIMYCICNNMKSTEIRRIIKEGKWYLEEAEDGEMQDL